MGRKLTEEECREYEKQRRASAERTAKLLGITVEELEEMENKAREAVYSDTDLEKELDAQNRAKAGIEVEDTDTRKPKEIPSGESPYALNQEAVTLISEISLDFDKAKECRVQEIILDITDDKKMSKYQLSMTYKALGECYESHNMEEDALQAYKTGIELNPSLSVKKTIKQLEKRLAQK